MPYFEWTLIGALRTLRSTHNNNDNQRSSMRTAYARSVPSFLAACALL
ncbi:TPA: tripartite tricarboxylate transporter substrate binding protein, partial [Pseudomonas aeruginosa]|nr:tripartite tricarboxylate transporter substrate binding protein [Pseudomonas aeruginosa]